MSLKTKSKNKRVKKIAKKNGSFLNFLTRVPTIPDIFTFIILLSFNDPVTILTREY